MLKCSLCGKEKHGKREMHGHLMFAHRNEYSAVGFNMNELIETVEDPEPTEKPAGFRYLRKTNNIESAAIQQGYLFIDEYENIYTEEEAAIKGWI